MIANTTERDQQGYALIAVMMLAALLTSVLFGYFMVTRLELLTTKSATDSSRGFYAAEAGLNLRAEEIRQTFEGFARPQGVAPDEANILDPCEGGNVGSGDFRCRTFTFGFHDSINYVIEEPANPISMVIPPGEPFENLNAQKYVYRVRSLSRGTDGRPEAILEMEFNSRLVPMFQFAAFYNKDLEVHPGPPMTLAGPVHSNGDLYLGSSGGLSVLGQVTTAGELYQGRKTDVTCYAGGVAVPDPGSLTSLPACPSSSLLHYSQADVNPWNGMVRMQVDPLTVPPPETFDPTPGEFYWDNADMRIVLDVSGTPAIQVRNPDGSVDAAGTATLTSCGPVANRAVQTSNTFHNLREAKPIRMLDVDVAQVMTCLHHNPELIGNQPLDESSGGGLAWFLSVMGPDADTINGYGVRLRNGAELGSNLGAAPAIQGLTVVSDQAAYIHGDYNSVNVSPAAVMADSINVLSGNYADGDHAFDLSDANRLASATEINAAILAGTDVTGGAEGAGGQGGAYNGGLENYPRLHEKWSGVTLRYRGSFVSLNVPRHVNGPHTTPGLYSPPNRDWGYDVSFNDAANLPPLTPRFVYLRQNLFVRDFEQ